MGKRGCGSLLKRKAAYIYGAVRSLKNNYSVITAYRMAGEEAAPAALRAGRGVGTAWLFRACSNAYRGSTETTHQHGEDQEGAARGGRGKHCCCLRCASCFGRCMPSEHI